MRKKLATKKIDSVLTDKIKKSSINTAPNGRIPAIRLLKQIMSTTLDEVKTNKQTNSKLYKARHYLQVPVKEFNFLSIPTLV